LATLEVSVDRIETWRQPNVEIWKGNPAMRAITIALMWSEDLQHERVDFAR
jgi:hypothetical protein